MKKHLIYWLAAAAVVMIGCQKELSFEGSNTPAHGSLQSAATGDCLPKTVNGIYVAASPLVPATNTISVQVNVTKTGTFVVATDTVNGYFFRATGTFTTLGANNVILRSSGTPFAQGVNNFVVSFDTTICNIAVTVLPVGSGPAVFSLTGSPGSCSGAVVNGAYAVGVPLNAADTVNLAVNVTTIGSYNITTAAAGGMTFSGTGAFTSTGVHTVTLTGSGTPTTLGANTIPVTAGTTNCSFVVTVTSQAVGTLGGGPGACTPSTVNGTYTVGTALTASNTVQVQISVTTAGVYNVRTDTVAGFSFAGTGTVAVGNNQTITLTGTGTPTTAGPQTFTVTFGTSNCTFSVTVAAGPTIDWRFTEGGSTLHQGTLTSASLNSSSPPFTAFSYSGSNATETLVFSLIDLIGGIQNNETYSTSATTSNAAAFIFNTTAGDTYTADPSTAGVTLVFTITSHNTVTKTISGTFSGTVKNLASMIITISNGQFSGTYP